MRYPPPELLYRDAAIIEYYVSNPDIPITFIANKFSVSVSTVDRAKDKYFPNIFGKIVSFKSDIDSQRAIDQEIMYDKIYKGEPILV